MEKTFTKGKWIVSEYKYVTSDLEGLEGNIICDAPIGFEDSMKNWQANAKLISSAPDLLEALMNIENDDNSIPKNIWDMRNKAIKKAIG